MFSRLTQYTNMSRFQSNTNNLVKAKGRGNWGRAENVTFGLPSPCSAATAI